jgi:hypothetical protein
MQIFVQSLLNSATQLPITITTTTTVAELKQLVWQTEGTTSTIQQLYFMDQELENTATVIAYSVVAGSVIGSSNNIADGTLWTKSQRQQLKLDLAQLRRQAGGNSNADFYRERNSYDISQLPTVYSAVTNDTASVIDNPNQGGLIIGRPWVESGMVILSKLLTEEGTVLLQENGSALVLE